MAIFNSGPFIRSEIPTLIRKSSRTQRYSQIPIAQLIPRLIPQPISYPIPQIIPRPIPILKIPILIKKPLILSPINNLEITINNIGIIYYNNDKNILLLKLSNNEWSLPFGSKNINELDDDAYKRIIKEKINIDLNRYDKKYYYKHSDGENTVIFTIMSNESILENDNLRFVKHEDLIKIINDNVEINSVSKLTMRTKNIINKIKIV